MEIFILNAPPETDLCLLRQNPKEKNMANLPMEADILPPSDDRIFKTLLTHPDANQVLIDIISTVIEQKILKVQIRGNELPVSDVEEKEQRFDINCTIENDDATMSQIDVEMDCTERVELEEKRTNFINKYT